jgi:hypothetical protein
LIQKAIQASISFRRLLLRRSRVYAEHQPLIFPGKPRDNLRRPMLLNEAVVYRLCGRILNPEAIRQDE